MLAMGPRDLNSAPYSPVHCSSHSMTSFQSSELTELPVVENGQLFAQRTVRPPPPPGGGGRKVPLVFWATDKPHLFLHFVLPAALRTRAIARVLSGGRRRVQNSARGEGPARLPSTAGGNHFYFCGGGAARGRPANLRRPAHAPTSERMSSGKNEAY